MAEYKPNSHKYRREQKELKTVNTGKVKVKKKSTAEKLFREFVPGSIDDIVETVVIPSVKKAIGNTLIDSLSMLFGVDTRRSKSSRDEYVSYRSYASRDYDRDRRRTPRDIDDVIFETRADAEDVLSEMDAVLDRYEFISVSDYYQIAGVKDNSYTNSNYGWSNLRSAEVVRLRDGWGLRLPRPKYID